MGEIKSTLDLVMEKTGHLKFSTGEKKEFEQEELAKRARSLIERFLNSYLPADKFQKEYKEARKEMDKKTSDSVLSETLEKIDFEGDNHKILELAELFENVERSRVSAVIEKTAADIACAKKQRAREIVSELAEKGVSGNAVVPNTDACDELKKALSGIRKEGIKNILSLF